MRNNKFRIILCVISIIVFVSSVSYLIRHEYNRWNEKKLIEEIQLKKQKNNAEECKQKNNLEKGEQNRQTEEIKIPEKKQLLSEYEQLYMENEDLCGWIKINNTVIDYPVMHTPENPNFYIHRNWEKQESSAGSIFIDGRCTEYSENLIVYGHNMKDRSMFGSLREYKEEEYYKEHKYIEFDTIYERAKYEIITVSKAIVYYEKEPPKDEYLFYEHVDLDSEEEFKEYVQSMKENAYFETGKTAEFGDQLITLCTCDYWTDNARLIIVAKKII